MMSKRRAGAAPTHLVLAAMTLLLVHASCGAQDLKTQYIQAARRMDAAYQSAGSRVDIAGFDLDECARQGKPVGAELRQRVAEADRDLRRQWLALEDRRKQIDRRMALAFDTPPQNVLSIENLTDDAGSGESDWFALRSAAVVLPGGEKIQIPPQQFRGATFRENYSYQCEPSAMAAVYGRQSSHSLMQAGFDIPDGPPPPQNATLEISGLDHDKPGRTPIAVSINGVEIFRGPNEFQKIGWSEKGYEIPAAAWSGAVEATSLDQVEHEIRAWTAEIAQFEAAGAQRADEIDQITASPRAGLVWQRREHPADWWKRGFLRGICYESDGTAEPQHNRPWFPDNKQYVAKAWADAGVNLIYDYPFGNYDESGVREYSTLARHNDPIGTPVIQVYWPLAHPFQTFKDPVKAARYYLDPAAAFDEAQAYLSRLSSAGNSADMLRGVAIDEPRIGAEEALHEVPEIVASFREYLARRQPVLQQAGISIDPSRPPVVKVTDPGDLPAWMEWQYFTMEYISDFYADIFRRMEKSNRLAVLIAQDYLSHEPQVAAFPAYGRKLPIVFTDLYNDAGVNEAFAMDLLRSVSSGKAILVNGSGYSARNPDRFHRTLANAMLRADGVLSWIYTYASKYRYRYYFVQPDMKDDRGRSLLDAWRPEYWDIFRSVYRGMAGAEPYLTDTEATASIGVLYSMRSVVAESAGGSFWGNRIARNNLFIYSALLDLHRPVEACMVEGLTPGKLARYRVLYLIDGQCLTRDECEMLRQWVRQGGTLIASGATSLKNEWGQAQADYALADLFGAHFESISQGQTRFKSNLPKLGALDVAYDVNFSYAKVRPDGAKVLAKWDNGDAALLCNAAGKGRAYLITADRPGYYACVSDPLSGRYRPAQRGFPELLRWLAQRHAPAEPISVQGAGEDVEIQIRRKGESWIVHILEWRQDRELTGLELTISLPKTWQAMHPMDGADAGTLDSDRPLKLRPVRVHDMIVLTPVQP